MDCTRKDYLRFSTCSRFNTAGVLCAEGTYIHVHVILIIKGF